MAKIGLRSNRKFRRLCAMLRLDSPAHAKGHLVDLWESTWENGNPLVGDFDDIEHAANWPTANAEKYPQGAFAAALVMVGFVDEIAKGRLYAIHDWYEHLPHFAKQALSRRAKEDATVGRETYFIGIEAWTRRAAEVGIVVDPYAEKANGAQTGQSDPDLCAVSGSESGETHRNGLLSSLGKSRQAERSEVTLPPLPPAPLAALPDPAALALWNQATQLLRTSGNRDQVETFVLPLRPESFDGSTLRLVAPNQRFAMIVAEEPLVSEIATAVSLVAERDVAISMHFPPNVPQPEPSYPSRRRRAKGFA